MRRKKIEIPVKLVELEEENYHILIEISFFDGKAGVWVIDTGASKTVMDMNLEQYFTPVENPLTEIQSMGIGDSNIDTKSGIISEIHIGKSVLHDLHVALIDLSQLNSLYHRVTKENITGLIGSDFLFRHRAVIDFKKLLLILYI